MGNKVYLSVPRGQPYSDEGINLALELQEELMMGDVIATSGVNYSKLRISPIDQLGCRITFSGENNVVFGSFNRLVVMILDMYDMSTNTQSWIKVDITNLETWGYKKDIWDSVVKQLLIRDIIDFAKDRDDNNYFKFRYDTLVDCKLNPRKFIKSLKNRTKEKSIAQNWSAESMHDHIKTILWTKVDKEIFIKTIDF